uniref:GPI inositol-deacylase n=1 Tax=Phaeomonas parva TaxID=124430 RepID=A0A7S1ULJ7_9STRA|mmetsp:Transcript_9431/g.27712  ORF Transcript_9431/g.27712 Transcript_9431/m.27712 type:complete len:638 (+) Transcript_9431:140-2053(+)
MQREALARNMPAFPPPPTLGALGMKKLKSFALLGLRLALASRAADYALHRGFGLRRGAIRGRLRGVMQTLRGLLLLPGATTLAVSGAILAVAYARALALRRARARSGSVGVIMDEALESLGSDLHAWAQKSEHLKTFSEADIGWLITGAPAELRRATPDVSDEFHHRLRLLREHKKSARGLLQNLLWMLGLARRAKLDRAQLVNALGVPPCRGGWDGLSILLVPGLLTKWYPVYFTSLRFGLERLGFDVHVSRLDTDLGVEANARVLRDEILCIANGSDPEDLELYPTPQDVAAGAAGAGEDSSSPATRRSSGRRRVRGRRKIAVYSHSKGAVDCVACFAAFPETIRHVAAFVSAQGPHGGSWLANDIACTKYQKAAVAMGIERLLAGSSDAVFDLSYEKRREFFKKYPDPVWTRVPTICLATCATHQPNALMSPVVEYMRYRYGDQIGATDGCVAMRDAVLPGAPVIWLMDMDHYGPAWNAFPALDRYDKTHVCLALISMALEEDVSNKMIYPSALRDQPRRDSSSNLIGFGLGLFGGQREGLNAYIREDPPRRRRRKRRHVAKREFLNRWMLEGTDESGSERDVVPRVLKVPKSFRERNGSGRVHGIERYVSRRVMDGVQDGDNFPRAKSTPSFI